MAEVDRRSRAILNSLQAARDERAAAAQEERQFMTSFNPNTAKREDFTRFRENLKEQALKLANARPDGGIMGAKNAEIFRSLYDDPYRKMMGQYMMTNPESYKSHFPKTYLAQRALPKIVTSVMGAASGIPLLGKMIPEQTNELLGDLSYLDYRPTRLGTPEGEVMREAYTSPAGFEYPEVLSTGAMEDYYDQFFPMQVPDYFYQFMDNEMLPYILGMR
jgi:hypothetical protein|tara:strand:- start:743 stop:1399 length:657 start_codon:yes stop_codon:yes gene_type:complete